MIVGVQLVQDRPNRSEAGTSDVHLNVGPPKTDFTYLQGLRWSHRQNLGRQGVLHPARHDNELWFASNDVQGSAFIGFELPEARGAWADVTGRVLRHPGRSVISHEVLDVDVSGWGTDDSTGNDSLDAVQTELVRRLNQVTDDVLDQRSMRALLDSGVIVHGDLADLAVSDDGWDQGTTEPDDADLPGAALELLATPRSDDVPPGVDFV